MEYCVVLTFISYHTIPIVSRLGCVRFNTDARSLFVGCLLQGYSMLPFAVGMLTILPVSMLELGVHRCTSCVWHFDARTSSRACQ